MPLPSGILWLFGAAIVASLACLIALAMVWVWAARQVAAAREHIVQLEQKIGVATSGAVGMGNRIVALERKLHALQEKQESIGGVDEFAYSQALQMFEQGADVTTVASNCGFSASEAQLMALVQQQLRKPAKASTYTTSTPHNANTPAHNTNTPVHNTKAPMSNTKTSMSNAKTSAPKKPVESPHES